MAGIVLGSSRVPHAQASHTGVVKGMNPNIVAGWPSIEAIHVHAAGAPARTDAAMLEPAVPSGSWQKISRRSSSRRLAPI